MKPNHSEAYKSGSHILDLINDIRISKNIEAFNPSWLENDFYDNVWNIRSDQDGIRRFDWHRMLPNGLFLTSDGLEQKSSSSRILSDVVPTKNKSYQEESDLRIQLNRLKRIVILFRHPRISSACNFQHHYHFFCWILDMAEWAFLNEDTFRTRQHLFSLIDSKDIEDGFLLPLARGGKAELLDYKSRLIAALNRINHSLKIDDIKTQCIKQCKNENIPYNIKSPFDSKLPFTHNEITSIRAWLYCNGYQIKVGSYKGKFSAELFFAKETSLDVKSDTLPDDFQAIFRALSSVKNHSVLEFTTHSVKEFLPAGEKSLIERLEQDEKPYNERIIDESKGMLQKLARIARHASEGLPPTATISEVSLKAIHLLDLAPKGHTKTIPANVSMHALGHAVPIIINHGNGLVRH